mgnify:CR=1 FL=1
MKILAIDSSGLTASIAILEDDRQDLHKVHKYHQVLLVLQVFFPSNRYRFPESFHIYFS